MNLVSLLYVSRSTINPVTADAELGNIVEKAHRSNPGLGLTGALIFTGANFAQILEGPADAVDAMMASISIDLRHTGIIVADRSPIVERRFAKWSMAYSGHVQFVERQVRELLNAPPTKAVDQFAKHVANLIYQFTIK